MTIATQTRYAPGGDIYASLQKQYGTDAANRMYQAALTEDPYDDNATLTQIKHGKSLNDSTASLFIENVTTNPLGAPLDSLNNQIGNAVLSVLKNPWVVAALAVFIFYQFGGFTWARKRFAS